MEAGVGLRCVWFACSVLDPNLGLRCFGYPVLQSLAHLLLECTIHDHMVIDLCVHHQISSNSSDTSASASILTNCTVKHLLKTYITCIRSLPPSKLTCSTTTMDVAILHLPKHYDSWTSPFFTISNADASMSTLIISKPPFTTSTSPASAPRPLTSACQPTRRLS